MANKRIIASSVRNVEHIAILDDLIAARMAGIDKSVVFMYLADIVKAPALIWLAKHFNVLGYRGWALATTEEQKRELIKEAIAMQSIAGTPDSIIDAIQSVGYTDVQVQERINFGDILYDGTHSYNGVWQYGTTHWTRIRVVVNASGLGLIDATTSGLLVELINIYKATRSHLLDGITYSFGFHDSLGDNGLEDGFGLIQGGGFMDTLYEGVPYDGTQSYDGNTAQYQSDFLSIQIII